LWRQGLYLRNQLAASSVGGLENSLVFAQGNVYPSCLHSADLGHQHTTSQVYRVPYGQLFDPLPLGAFSREVLCPQD
jgi:hypothetical protein